MADAKAYILLRCRNGAATHHLRTRTATICLTGYYAAKLDRPSHIAEYD